MYIMHLRKVGEQKLIHLQIFRGFPVSPPLLKTVCNAAWMAEIAG